jgi:hypothetical protein
MTSKIKLVAWAAVAVCLSLLLWGLFLSIPPTPAPLQVSILGRTNDSSGGAKTLVRVANSTRRIYNFTFWAEVQSTNAWIEAENWDPEGRLYWINGHDVRQLALPAPEGAKTWRLKFVRYPQPSALEWRWYAIVRWAGLKRVGLLDQPPHSYFYTAQIKE